MAGVSDGVNRGTWGTTRGVVAFALLLTVATTTAPVVGAVGVGASPTAVGAERPDAPASAPASVTSSPVTDARLAQADEPAGNDSTGNGSGRNNSSVAHRNPNEVTGDSELGAAERWLARDFGGGLPEGVNVSAAERRRARQLVENDSEFAELAEQYAEAAGESDESGRNVEQFRVVGAAQQQFLSDVQQYRQTRERYERARATNRTRRTRAYAHLLERRLLAVNESARWLNESYADLSPSEQSELGNVPRRIGGIRSNVTETQREVRRETLVQTELSVEVNRSSASFTDPAALSGRLRTANGTPVADETVTLAVGNRTLNVTTDEDGRFSTAYRPTVAAVGSGQRSVEFRPANRSVYRWSNASVGLAVEQVAAEVVVTNRTDPVRYNETVGVGGRVEANGVGASGVPVVVSVGGVPVERTRTDSNGSFAATRRLPANVSAGPTEVRVSVPLSGRALAPANASTRVTVESTATNLSITSVQPVERTAFVVGRLRSADGEALANRTVELRVGNETVGAATTNATGQFATTVGLPSDARDAESVHLTAAFSSPGNLDASRANATLALSSGGALPDGGVRLGVAGLLGVAVLGVVVWRFRSGEDGQVGSGGDSTVGAARDRARGRSPEALLDSANAAIEDAEYDAAAVAAYASVRERLARDERVDGSRRPRTHWEFLAACRDAELPEGRLAELERLTETYERAAFAADSVAPSDAATAVEIARSSVPDREGSGATDRGREESSGHGLGEGSAV